MKEIILIGIIACLLGGCATLTIPGAWERAVALREEEKAQATEEGR